MLLVDDSRSMREAVRSILEKEVGITVAGEAADGAQAVARVRELKPDLVLMDLEMPVMGGLEAIERISAEHPVPILALTSLTGVQTAFAAVAKGALDVMEKPELYDNVQKLVQKIRLLANVDVRAHRETLQRGKSGVPGGGVRPRPPQGGRIVAIAASTGGPQAIQLILSRLPGGFPAPIVMTQHIAEGFALGMVEWLNSTTGLTVTQAANGERLVPGHAYLNPPEQAMRVTRQGVILLGERDPRLVYHPSCDTLLKAVADAYGERAVGVILTGMGDDGVLGMEAIRKAGGVTLAQDARSSAIFGMNGLALQRGCIDRTLPLAEIAGELLALVSGR